VALETSVDSSVWPLNSKVPASISMITNIFDESMRHSALLPSMKDRDFDFNSKLIERFHHPSADKARKYEIASPHSLLPDARTYIKYITPPH